MDQNKTYYMDVANMSKKEGADKDAMMKKSMDKYNSDLKNILDKTQYERYSSMNADYMIGTKNKQMEQAPANKDMQREE